MKKVILLFINLFILISVCGCSTNKVKNNTSGKYKLITNKKDIENNLIANVWEKEIPSGLCGYIFLEDGTLYRDYYGAFPNEYFRVGALNDIEDIGTWFIDEDVIYINYDGYEYGYKMYIYDKKNILINDDWDQDYEGKYSFLNEDDKDFIYDNSPSDFMIESKDSNYYYLEPLKDADIKEELVGIWTSNKDNLNYSNIILFKSNGLMAFSVNLAGTNVTHYGRWLEKNGKIYICGFDEYSGNDYYDMNSSNIWHEFEYELKDNKLKSERLFYDYEYEYYGSEDLSLI